MDWDTALYDPLFGVFGVVATLTIGTEETSLTVIDHTTGIEIEGNGLTMPTIKPAAFVRLTELASNSIEASDLIDATLTIRGNTWTIKNTAPKPGPDGKGTGELQLILINGDL